MSKFSVLMAVYGKDNPHFFAQAIQSLVDQTLTPNEIVLVQDGPLTVELENVVDQYKGLLGNQFNVIALSKNVGLGLALQEGLLHCSHELVARMDSDDLSKPTRFEKQVEVMMNDPSLSVLGTWLEEFEIEPLGDLKLKKVPVGGRSLEKYSRKRNPLNHPTVMFRKSAILKAGNYLDAPYFEDYHLWARLLLQGSKIQNLQESLLYFRKGAGFLKRRAGSTYARQERLFLKRLFDMGFLNLFQWMAASFIRNTLRILPLSVVQRVYAKFLR